MKKIPFLLLIALTLNALGQTSEWFVSIETGAAIGGPSISIKNQMTAQGFSYSGQSNFLGFSFGPVEYPLKSKTVSLLVRAGKKVSHHRSIYVLGGLLTKGEVRGFNANGYATLVVDNFYNPYPTLTYSLFQFTSGFMYSFQNSHSKLGLGPSLFLLHYYIDNRNKHLSVVPGVSFTGRFPFGKEKKLFGVDLLLEANLAPAINMKTDETSSAKNFQPSQVNMISGRIGLAFSFRK